MMEQPILSRLGKAVCRRTPTFMGVGRNLRIRLDSRPAVCLSVDVTEKSTHRVVEAGGH